MLEGRESEQFDEFLFQLVYKKKELLANLRELIFKIL